MSDTEDQIELYERGFVGAAYSKEAADHLKRSIYNSGGNVYASEAIDAYRLFGSGEGKLVLPYVAAMTLYPDCLPGGAQERGSCVAWNTRNAALVSYCAHVMYGNERIAAPPVSETARKNGVCSTEGIYWHRQKDSDGWFCDAAVDVAMTKCGLLLRKPYPSLGLDLTEYSPVTEGKWGRIPPPQHVAEAIDDNLVKNATIVENYEQARDLLANGYALSTCGSEAFSKRRSGPYGICERAAGTWYHAMAIVAGDFRKETMDKEGPLFLVQNSWGNYLGDSHNRVYGTTYTIPVGSFWARWEDIRNRRMIAVGASHGWPAQELPDFGLVDIV